MGLFKAFCKHLCPSETCPYKKELLAKEIWLEHRIKLLMKKNKNNDKFGEISLNINGNHRSDNFIKINGNETNISELKNSFDKSKKISIDVNNLNYQKPMEKD